MLKDYPYIHLSRYTFFFDLRLELCKHINKLYIIYIVKKQYMINIWLQYYAVHNYIYKKTKNTITIHHLNKKKKQPYSNLL